MKKSKSNALRPHRFALYEAAVQTPEQHADLFALMYSDIRGRSAHVLREDFCGTFLISCAWVKRDPLNRALCLDLDQETLKYGRAHHYKNLLPRQKKNLTILRQDVLSATKPLADITVACNFSFFIFKERATLVQYFKKVLSSLNSKGLLVLELAGGPGMIEPTKEQKTFQEPEIGRFAYIWQQKNFNPILRHGQYAIHFKLADGTFLKDCFTYDWRVWTIPELRDALQEAGFSQSFVYWEDDSLNGKDRIHEYRRTETGDNAYSYIAYVVGAK